MSSRNDIFKQINNTLLDLQASDLQSYPSVLKRLGRHLQHPDLLPFNEILTKNIDLDDFLKRSEATQGGIGSGALLWPDDDLAELGLKLLLIQKFGREPEAVTSFGHDYFWTGSRKVMSGVTSVINQIIIPFARDYKAYIEAEGKMEVKLVLPVSSKVFIVHGHDGEARESVARFISSVGLTPVILNEQANQGKTVIEKVEANSDVGFAVVLLTPDDMGRSNNERKLEPRVRQNVLLELGYFIARLGRPRVCALKKGTVSIPSDFAGVVWEPMEGEGWKLRLAKELKASGYEVDASRLIG